MAFRFPRVMPSAASVLLRRSMPVRSPVNFMVPSRAFGTQSAKLLECLQQEVSHEQSNYTAPEQANKFLASSGWKLTDAPGNVNMKLAKEVDGMLVCVEFQLVSAYNGQEENQETNDATDFSVVVQNKNGSGVVMYCTTMANTEGEENYRFMIGNMQAFENEEERALEASYNGPDFEDLDQTLQQAIDEWCGTLGINDELCDFIDQTAIDKEEREYMRWLQTVTKMLQ